MKIRKCKTVERRERGKAANWVMSYYELQHKRLEITLRVWVYECL